MSIHIVTDSWANFASPQFASDAAITIVPNRINIGGVVYHEGVEITLEDAFQRIAKHSTPPTITAPAVDELVGVYRGLLRKHDTIISIHASREIGDSWKRARDAAQQVGESVKVVDSRTVGAAQGFLVQIALDAIRKNVLSADDIVRLVRGGADRVYAAYYAETVDFLAESKILSESHTILCKMLGVKPFLSIEEGRLVGIEKVKNRAQAVERLAEFVGEFVDIDRAVILQHKPYMTEQTRLLQDRLAVEFPNQHFPYMMYNPSLATLIGADATGIVILEEAEDEF